MRHLETKREAAERRRVALMSQGIAKFLERTSQNSFVGDDVATAPEDEEAGVQSEAQNEDKTEEEMNPEPPKEDKKTVLDKIRTALDYAADILRESLELTAGGVVFLDPTIGYTDNDSLNTYNGPTVDLEVPLQQVHHEEKGRASSNGSQHRPDLVPLGQLEGGRHLSNGSIRSAKDKHKASKIMAMSSGNSCEWDSKSDGLDTKTLQSLIKSYPQGNIWYTDEDGYFSSLEQISDWDTKAERSPSRRGRSISPIDSTKRREEAAILSRFFQDARQIMFLPLWDAGGGKCPNLLVQ